MKTSLLNITIKRKDKLVSDNIFNLEISNRIVHAILILILSQSIGYSQTCLPGSTTFATQADIDNFATNFPGCTQIGGHLSINESSPGVITNLNGLSPVTSVDGTLFISADNLPNLTGLENITTLGALRLVGNHTLTNINALSNLTTINKLTFTDNDALINLSGLENITTLNDDVIIENNDGLTGLDGLDNLTSVSGFLAITSNPALLNLSGLDNLTNVGEYVKIQHNIGLINLTGLNELTTVGGYLSFFSNTNLESLTGLEKLVTIGGFLEFGSLHSLINISALTALTSLGGSCTFRNNPLLSNFSGLDNLNSISGNVELHNNNNITSFSGFDNITSITGYLKVTDNDNLPNFNGLENVNSIGGYLDVSRNDALANFNGLQNLSSIGSNLTISNNDLLTNLDDLTNLTSMAGHLSLSLNDGLTSLNGLDNIDHETITSLAIINNTILSTCEVQSICDFVLIISNSANISGNASGCTTRPEVETTCNAALPVSLIHFTARHKNSKIILEWSTASELNNKGFYIEHSIDGRNWQTLHFVKGIGNSSELNTYQFDHYSNFSGANYYRLSQLDFNGNTTYSKIVSVLLGKTEHPSEFSIFPNPSNGILHFVVPTSGIQNIQIRLISLVGEVLREYNKSTSSTISYQHSIHISDLNAGIYFVQIKVGEKEFQQQIVIK